MLPQKLQTFTGTSSKKSFYKNPLHLRDISDEYTVTDSPNPSDTGLYGG